jgi:putative membrane protein
MFITDWNGNPVYLGWQFDPVLIGNLLTLSVLYLLATTVLRQRLAPGETFPKSKAILFFSGIFILWAAEGSPLHDLSERYLFSAHMVQHLLINYFAAPLLIWGTPEWVFRPLLLNRFVKPVAKFVLQAVVATLVFNLGLSIWHIPQIYDAGLQNSSVHHLVARDESAQGNPEAQLRVTNSLHFWHFDAVADSALWHRHLR